MKAVVQRARCASVTVDGKITGRISRGLLVYLGVAREDGEKDAAWMAEKIANLRIFEDTQGKMNLSIKDIITEDILAEKNLSNENSSIENLSNENLSNDNLLKASLTQNGLSKDGIAADGEGPVGVLAVSQFTLLGDAAKGRRPYYGDAADPEKANALYVYFMEKVREQGLPCESGVFQAHMDVRYTNDGPVTIILES